MNRATILAALLLLGLTAPASAHLEDFTESKIFSFGPYTAMVNSDPAPPTAGIDTALTLRLNTAVDGAFRAAPNTTRVTYRLSNATENFTGSFQDTFAALQGTWRADIPHLTTGNWTLNLSADNGDGPSSGETTFHVYPDLGLRIKPLDNSTDPQVDKRYSISFRPVWRDNQRAMQGPQPTDLSIRVQHWNDAHDQLLDEHTVPLKQGADGQWTWTPRFNSTGMRHLTFASTTGNFTFDDLPILHVYVLPAQPEPPSTLERFFTPMRTAVLLGCAALLAFWAYGLRKKKGPEDDMKNESPA